MALNRRVTLTVTIGKKNYEKLKMIVASGKVSEVINELVEEWLEKKEKEIANDYQQDIQDKEHDKQVESWYLINRKRIEEKEKNEK